MKKLLVLSFVLGLFLCVNAENKNEEPVNITVNSADCVSGTFSEYEDGICIAQLILMHSCRFRFENHEDRISAVGTYELSNEVESRGDSATIYFYSNNGESLGYGTMWWPVDGKLTVIFGDFTLVKSY